MSTIKSSDEHLTLNADGSSKDIKFQANGVEKASISSAGAFTSTTIDATKLTGNLPAISAASLTNIPAANITGALPAISGASLTGLTSSQMPTGSILQVVQTVKTDTATYVSSQAEKDIMSATITPSSTSSKILIMTSLNVSYTSYNWEWRFWFERGGTDIGIGDASGSRPRATFGVSKVIDDYMPAPISFTYMDTPSTTSSTTYKLKFQSWSNQFRINQAHTDANSSQYSPRLISTLTLMEIAG